MPSSRDASLPEGVGDLIDAITIRQQTEKALGEIEEEVRELGLKLAPIIFFQLRPRIDRDLLFTTETELVLPKIREVTREVLLNSSRSKSEWMVDTISQQVVSFISYCRPSSATDQGVAESAEAWWTSHFGARKISGGAIYHRGPSPN
jgi:hypothetical protein